MKCPYCGFESPTPFQTCPACRRPQTVSTQPAAYSYAPIAPNTASNGMSGGEVAAIIIAIVVSVLSIIAAFVIFIVAVGIRAEESNTPASWESLDDYGFDAFDDSDSNDYLDDFFDRYFDARNDENYSVVSPADLHTPIAFHDEFYSFSSGFVQTDYEVELDETYRGQAALKLLEGAVLPELAQNEEIYLARFKVKVTGQDKESFVALSTVLPAACDAKGQTYYESLIHLDYRDNTQLLAKDQEGYRWMAFVVDKDEAHPLIMWYKYDERYFCDTQKTVSDASGLEAGGALTVRQDDSTEK